MRYMQIYVICHLFFNFYIYFLFTAQEHSGTDPSVLQKLRFKTDKKHQLKDSPGR